MRFRFQYRRYRLPFRAAFRTRHGMWVEREGVIVRLEDESGAAGLGEAAPIHWFGTETVDEVEEACRELGEWTDEARLEAVPPRLGCLRNAIANARQRGIPPTAHLALGVAALLPAGRAAVDRVEAKAESGFRVFKWKVGVEDIAVEMGLLDDICAILPSGAKLRLDANGAWDRRQAERWLERCAERPVEFVEQPCFAGAAEGTAARDRMNDLLLGLAGDYPTALALDESLIRTGDVERWIGAGWPGVFVVKPALLGDVAGALDRLARARAAVVFSSALETAVGTRAALQVAFAWRGEGAGPGSQPARALGFGVWPLFTDARFDGLPATPFLRREDVSAIEPEAIWNALS